MIYFKAFMIHVGVSTALLSVTTVNYLLSLVSLIMFYIYYTHSDGCTENKIFISLNMLLCMGASIVSILPQIQVWFFSEDSCRPGTGAESRSRDGGVYY